MLTTEEFRQWSASLGLLEQTVKQIVEIRNSPPSRRVGSFVGNVRGRYPSKKMGVTIQFESHRNELAGIYEMEYDPEVLEYYDQPPTIKLLYQAKNGRRVGVLHTPDFFVIRTTSAGWEEWKTVEELTRLASKMPSRYVLSEKGRWQCPPGENAAQELGLYYRVRCDSEINWKLQRNLRFLEDYLASEHLNVPTDIKEKIITIICSHPGIKLAQLLSEAINPDHIYTLIANQQLYVDLESFCLASEPEKIPIFLDQETGKALLHKTTNSNQFNFNHSKLVRVGLQGLWNGTAWQIVNVGETTTALIGETKKIIQLPNTELSELIRRGDFNIVGDLLRDNDEINQYLMGASEKDCAEASRRYGIIAPYLQGEPPKFELVPERTFYRWVSSWRTSEAIYGYGYLGLLPKKSHRGNRQKKLPNATQKLIDEFISNEYETLKQKGKFAAYAALYKTCLDNGVIPPSYKTFVSQIDQRPCHEKTLARLGLRMAYQHESFYWELKLTTPRHGDRPFEICHIDHTELDIELISSRTQVNLGRPWATFLTDAYSRRILAVYLTFDPPSYRSCMMVMRECVRRYGRLPQTVVVDGGKEFESVYFEKLLAAYSVTKKTRPSAKPRFGSVCERLFGTANTMLIHNLQGNTQITRNVRAVTKSVNPRNLAIWTLGSLYQNLCDWVDKFYDNKEHPGLGESPKSAFEEKLLQTGFRSHKLIAYNETFRILTLPTTAKGTAKVIPLQGVKINHIYYWHNSFRNSEIEKTQVSVRYDPYDVGIAYAYIKGQWVSCISQHYSTFAGHSEREMMVASVELRKQNQNHSKQFTVTAKALAEFLKSAEAQEAVLLQRLRDLEAKEVLSVIDGERVEQKSHVTEQTEDLFLPPLSIEPSDNYQQSESEEIEPYEEFW